MEDINSWVSDHTEKMIPDILDEIPEDAVLYLVNALAFDAEWMTVYEGFQVREGEFAVAGGDKQNVDFMYSQEYGYLQDGGAQGFLKYYKDGRYAFAAILPEEGISTKEYVSGLTGEKLYSILENPIDVHVRAAIPKFETAYSTELSDVLKDMGMPDAFDSERADFSVMGRSADGRRFYISRVLHKAYIAVDEKGTKAGAATAVEGSRESAIMEPEDIKTVYLDRPFVYMIIDCERNLPVFMGTVENVDK